MTSDSENQLMSSIASPVPDNSVAEPIIFEERSLTVFKGRILDGVTKDPIAASIDITINKTGDIYTSLYSNSATGKFLLSLPAGENYGISDVSLEITPGISLTTASVSIAAAASPPVYTIEWRKISRI